MAFWFQFSAVIEVVSQVLPVFGGKYMVCGTEVSGVVLSFLQLMKLIALIKQAKRYLISMIWVVRRNIAPEV